MASRKMARDRCARSGSGSFAVAPTAVSNEEFATFVDATGHVSAAERFGWSFVFAGLLPDDFPPTRSVAEAPWWRQVEGLPGATPRAPDPRSRSARTTRWCMCPGPTRVPTAAGPASACQAKRSGSTPRGGARAEALPVGGRADSRRGASLQHLAGRVPPAQHAGGRLLRYRAGRGLPPEWLRAAQHFRQCVGMVCRLVRRGAGAGQGEGHPRWLVPLSQLVLQPLPSGRAQPQHAGNHDRAWASGWPPTDDCDPPGVSRVRS